MDSASHGEIGAPTRDLVAFIAASASRALPTAVADKAKLHIVDTLAAMVSGTELVPGQKTLAMVRREDGGGGVSVVGTRLRLPIVTAAFANGMTAHADETDDSHAASLTHPGCAVLPCALGYGEVFGSSGTAFLNAVVTGYEVAARINTALGVRALTARGHGPHSIGGHWGAGAAGASLAGFDERQLRWVLSYVGQQTAGISCWPRDHDHVLKAFVFAGMPSRNGAHAIEMVRAGLPGMDDVLSGPRNMLFALCDDPKPELISAGLGTEFAISTAAIKKWCVGSPIQAALDSLEVLLRDQVRPDEIKAIRAHIPDHAVSTIDDNHMPDVNLQHCFALMLLEGTLTFAAAHDMARMQAPDVLALKKLVEIVPSAELTVAVPARQAIVEIDTRDGRTLTHRTYAVRGTPGDPMPAAEVIAKATELMLPILGRANTDGLIDTVMTIEDLSDVNALSRFWA